MLRLPSLVALLMAACLLAALIADIGPPWGP